MWRLASDVTYDILDEYRSGLGITAWPPSASCHIRQILLLARRHRSKSSPNGNPISRKFIIMPTRDAPPRSYQRSRERQKSAIAALVLVFALLGGCVLSLLP
jgi:hypothetical protein